MSTKLPLCLYCAFEQIKQVNLLLFLLTLRMYYKMGIGYIVHLVQTRKSAISLSFTDVLLGGVASPRGTNFDEMALSDSPFELK